MLPIKDHNPSGKKPLVTYAIIATCVAVFIYTLLETGSSNDELYEFYDDFALQPEQITSGNELITLITSMFMHGDIMHLGSNMLFLWVFGDNLEARLGHVKYFIFYIMSGLAASWAQILSDPSSVVFNLGASGAIAGVMGGYLLLWPKAKIDVIIFIVFIIQRLAIPAWIVLIYWFGLQIFETYLNLGSDINQGGVAYWAHIGGFVAGVIFAIPFWFNNKSRPDKVFVRGHYRHRS